jgi:120 KDa Rickettsia surface antigen
MSKEMIETDGTGDSIIIGGHRDPNISKSLHEDLRSDIIIGGHRDRSRSQGLSSENIDPITQFVRDNVIEKKLEILKDWMQLHFIEKEPEKEEGIKTTFAAMNVNQFGAFLAEQIKNGKYKDTLDAAYKDTELTTKMRGIETDGYTAMHAQFSELQKADWKATTVARQSAINYTNKDGADVPLITQESQSNVKLSNGQTAAEVRTINIPTQIPEDVGGAHFTFTSKTLSGRNMKEPAVRASIHYSEDGKLIEANFPAGLQFDKSDPQSIGHFTHKGETYTTGFTYEKYQEIMKEVAKNKGMGAALEVPKQEMSKDTVSVGKGRDSKSQEHILDVPIPSNIQSRLQEPLSPIPPAPKMPPAPNVTNIKETKGFEQLIHEKAKEFQDRRNIKNTKEIDDLTKNMFADKSTAPNAAKQNLEAAAQRVASATSDLIDHALGNKKTIGQLIAEDARKSQGGISDGQTSNTQDNFNAHKGNEFERQSDNAVAFNKNRDQFNGDIAKQSSQSNVGHNEGNGPGKDSGVGASISPSGASTPASTTTKYDATQTLTAVAAKLHTITSGAKSPGYQGQHYEVKVSGSYKKDNVMVDQANNAAEYAKAMQQKLAGGKSTTSSPPGTPNPRPKSPGGKSP